MDVIESMIIIDYQCYNDFIIYSKCTGLSNTIYACWSRNCSEQCKLDVYKFIDCVLFVLENL